MYPHHYYHHAASSLDWIAEIVVRSAIWSTTSRLLRSMSLAEAVCHDHHPGRRVCLVAVAAQPLKRKEKENMKKPVHTCLVHGRTVHFYDAPPDKPMRMPWVDAEAFFAAAGQSKAYPRFPEFAATQAPDAHMRVSTAKGTRLVISFHLAVGLIDGKRHASSFRDRP